MSRLPMEVLERIMDLGAQEPTENTRSRIYPTLLAWSLTSRSCTPRSRKNLFHHVVLHNALQIQGFATVLANRPYLAAFVAEVTIAPHPHPFLSFSLLLRTLSSISFVKLSVDWTKYPPWYSERMSCFAAVGHLQLTGTTFDNLAHFVRLLRAFPQLETLSMRAVKFNKEPSEEVLLHNLVKDVSKKLKTIHIVQTPFPLNIVHGLGFATLPRSLRLSSEPGLDQMFILECQSLAWGNRVDLLLSLEYATTVYAMPGIMPAFWVVLTDYILFKHGTAPQRVSGGRPFKPSRRPSGCFIEGRDEIHGENHTIHIPLMFMERMANVDPAQAILQVEHSVPTSMANASRAVEHEEEVMMATRPPNTIRLKQPHVPVILPATSDNTMALSQRPPLPCSVGAKTMTRTARPRKRKAPSDISLDHYTPHSSPFMETTIPAPKRACHEHPRKTSVRLKRIERLSSLRVMENTPVKRDTIERMELDDLDMERCEDRTVWDTQPNGKRLRMDSNYYRDSAVAPSVVFSKRRRIRAEAITITATPRLAVKRRGDCLADEGAMEKSPRGPKRPPLTSATSRRARRRIHEHEGVRPGSRSSASIRDSPHMAAEPFIHEVSSSRRERHARTVSEPYVWHIPAIPLCPQSRWVFVAVGLVARVPTRASPACSRAGAVASGYRVRKDNRPGLAPDPQIAVRDREYRMLQYSVPEMSMLWGTMCQAVLGMPILREHAGLRRIYP